MVDARGEQLLATLTASEIEAFAALEFTLALRERLRTALLETSFDRLEGMA